ncbi:4Fe-4S dicluster domain-containing protein [Treponema brennaborense]|uniref:Ferredoxin hydrogenase n=1 Tax=Treponema brennaborense (strain DSM 12168 / CIP 105900 / DD5/3) TaxID=906968 RepID=F4LLT0_TREBD|nr:4Fe-4S dicluster domain-containing protein [Treponema brennaborense]AEE17724.1 Ferredoxin hydrogenase [Treponema brennaborense DSM 12168]
MLNINNNAAQLKREILVRIAKLQLEGKLEEGVHYIPREMAPVGSQPVRCCIYHDREILRQRVMARLGCSVENYDDEKKLAEFAHEALNREKPTWPMLTVLDEACNACVRSHYMVTNACQACLARPCMMNCAKKAIAITEGRARIDPEKCVNCGLCMQNCPYHAIIKIPVPCEEACPVGAISKDETGKERIDYHKCIFCGNCMRECPFGAMMDKSQLVDVLKRIMDGKKVVAMYAPAIAAQFRAAPGQLEGALKQAGFARTWEVAIGADITADKEAHEFEERMERGDKMMTTSCCPAYVRAVHKHVPELSPCISDTRSPMHYTAEIAKKADPDCVSVFIGPCLAKRREGMDDEFVDYVLSIEEIGALFVAKGIDVAKTEAEPGTIIPTVSGRNFAVTGGVAESVRVRLTDPEKLKAAVINGLNKAGMKQLAQYGKIRSGEAPYTADCPNLIEVMACEGGCIAGPSVITNPKVAAIQLKKYVEAGASDKTNAE